MSVSEDLSRLREVMFTALLSDCLDQVGLRGQAMPSRIRPLDDAKIMVGRARTGAYMEVYHVEAGVNPYELEMDLIDSLAPDEIPVFACSNPGRVAPWGGIAVHGRPGAGRGGCCDGWLRAGHPRHPRHGLSRLPRRHRAAGQ